MAQKKRLVYLVVFVIGVALLLAPFFTKNHIYQGVALGGDTMKAFIPMINASTNGASIMGLGQYGGYFGLWIAMWFLGIINKILHVNPEILFYLYSICVLLATAITLYYFGKKIVGGIRSGWITLVIGILVSTSILALYTWGCTVNIINVYVVLMWAILFYINWAKSRRWYWLLASALLLILFMFLHPTGFYLPFTILVLCVGVIGWSLVKKRKLQSWVIGLLILLVSTMLVTWRYSGAIGLHGHNIFDIDYLVKFVRILLIPVPTIIGVLTIVAWWRNRHNTKLSMELGIALSILGSLLVVLIGASVLQLTILPERQILDASSVGAIIVALILAYLIKTHDLQWLKASAYALMALGSLVSIRGWVI